MSTDRRLRLLELKSNLFAKSDQAKRNTIFRDALIERDVPLLQVLFQTGAGALELSGNPTEVFESAFTPFSAERTQLFLHHGWKIPDAALYKLAISDNIPAVQFLLERNGITNPRALVDATLFSGNNNIVVLLLKNGFDPNTQDEHGTTPLMLLANYWESYKEQREILRILIEAGSRLDIRDNKGLTVFDFGREWPDLQRLLKNYAKKLATS